MAVNGTRIKKRRLEAGLTQSELGQKLGVVKQTISSWEKNISEPNSETLTTLSKLFDVSIDYLLGNDLIETSPQTPYATQKGFFFFFFDDLLKNVFMSRLKKTLTEKEISVEELSQRGSFDIETCNAYINGECEPSLEHLIELSQLLDVSTDYLLGQIPKITYQEKKLLNAFVKLNEDNQDIIIGKTKELLKEQEFYESVAADEPLEKTGTDNQGK